jgi:hypothetical protein
LRSQYTIYAHADSRHTEHTVYIFDTCKRTRDCLFLCLPLRTQPHLRLRRRAHRHHHRPAVGLQVHTRTRRYFFQARFFVYIFICSFLLPTQLQRCWRQDQNQSGKRPTAVLLSVCVCACLLHTHTPVYTHAALIRSPSGAPASALATLESTSMAALSST